MPLARSRRNNHTTPKATSYLFRGDRKSPGDTYLVSEDIGAIHLQIVDPPLLGCTVLNLSLNDIKNRGDRRVSIGRRGC